jgi:nitrite reductase/ring-hydroxylating ferredoxin subunit/uncharacterized membrane protein
VQSAASFKGHPIHPMLVVFPLAFWLGSLVADVVYIWLGNPFFYNLSWYLIAAGIVGAVAAAIPGTIDYFHSVTPYSGCKPIGRRHGIINASITVLYALNLWWRAQPEAGVGSEWWCALAASLVGVAALSYSGWLGGDLVYNCEVGRRQTQVGGQPTIYGPRLRGEPGEFVEIARSDELGVGQVKHVTVNGAWIGLARTDRGYFAFDEICTHKGGPLCDGVLMDETIQCPWHGSRFDIRTGEVKAGPARARIHTFEIRVGDDRISVKAPEGPQVAAKAKLRSA